MDGPFEKKMKLKSSVLQPFALNCGTVLHPTCQHDILADLEMIVKSVCSS